MKSKPWVPYVAPMAIYFVFLLLQSNTNLVWIYPLKTVAVAAALWFFRKKYEELCSPMWCGDVRRRSPDRARVVDRQVSAQAEGETFGQADVRGQETPAQQRTAWEPARQEPRPPSKTESGAQQAGGAPALQSWVLAVIVGLMAIAIWIGIDPYYPKPGNGAAVFDSSGKWVFIGFRVAGAVIVVPLMEELFWRAFLIRYIVNEDFKKVPVGTFTWPSFAITVALFGAEHHEWLAGAICGMLYNWLLYKRKDVFSCVVAHAVSNAALAAWVLARGDWKFW
jgi:Type II CAAX prenyl endopeptidase Rce1-like